MKLILRSIIVPQSSVMKSGQLSSIGKYPTTRTRMTPVVSEAQDIGYLDPLRPGPIEKKTEDCAAEMEEQSEVDLKWEEYFEDLVEEEDFKMEDEEGDNLVDVKDFSENEPILVLNTKVLDQ